MLNTTVSRKIVFFVSLLLLLGCSAGVFLLVVTPTGRLQADYNVFSALDGSLARLQIELLRTQTHPVRRQKPAIEAALADLDEQFAYFENGSWIRDRSEAAMKAVSSLEDHRRAIQAGSRMFLGEYSREEALFSPEFTALVVQFTEEIDHIRSDLAVRLPVLAGAIQSWRMYSYLVSGTIILMTWLLGLLVVWFYARVVSKNSGHVSDMLESLVSGDLSGGLDRLPQRERENAQSLPGKFAQFVDSLRQLAASLREEASGASGSGEQLLESVDNASSTFEVVDGFIENMRNETTILEEQVRTVKTALERVTSGLNQLDRGILDQKDVVDGSLASVQSMIGAVSEMAAAATRDETVVRDLVDSSGESREQFVETYNKITRISESISRINGMAEIIENIAEQTNMLALNAAIEAAHAGDAGKGFAVVAEEITKLADASSESSREIASSIEEIIENITGMAQSSGELDRSFEVMITDINTVHETIGRLSSGLVKTSSDTTHVLETMNTLQNVSNDVTRNSGLMAEGTGTIADSMRELEMISGRVFEGITAISLMLDGLKEAMTTFRSIAESMKHSGEKIEARLEQLK
ncbi:MAG TPA: methyl-accepting chemotaxis protein [Treponemataceae bacterium]|nr:methyl-accepting chemotaxis protein [Treponemataceae bacterium]